jgi:hypothetical protein
MRGVLPQGGGPHSANYKRIIVIARNAATKQSMPQQAALWIASLRSQ